MNLNILVDEGANIPRHSNTNECNTYVDISFGNSSINEKTRVIKGSSNPKWDEEFKFLFTPGPNQLIKFSIVYEVEGSREEPFSQLVLSTGQIEFGEMYDQWFDFKPYKGIENGGSVKLAIQIAPKDHTPFTLYTGPNLLKPHSNLPSLYKTGKMKMLSKNALKPVIAPAFREARPILAEKPQTFSLPPQVEFSNNIQIEKSNTASEALSEFMIHKDHAVEEEALPSTILPDPITPDEPKLIQPTFNDREENVTVSIHAEPNNARPDNKDIPQVETFDNLVPETKNEPTIKPNPMAQSMPSPFNPPVIEVPKIVEGETFPKIAPGVNANPTNKINQPVSGLPPINTHNQPINVQPPFPNPYSFQMPPPYPNMNPPYPNMNPPYPNMNPQNPYMNPQNPYMNPQMIPPYQNGPFFPFPGPFNQIPNNTQQIRYPPNMFGPPPLPFMNPMQYAVPPPRANYNNMYPGAMPFAPAPMFFAPGPRGPPSTNLPFVHKSGKKK